MHLKTECKFILTHITVSLEKELLWKHSISETFGASESQLEVKVQNYQSQTTLVSSDD
jgi:hypothetical protein